MNPIARARQLRRKSTWAEKALWRILRNQRFSGYKFRRQHPAGEYTLDFYCPEAKLAIETDGLGHGHPERRLQDEARDEFFRSQGILVKRIWNSQLRRASEAVREALWQLLQERAPHPDNVKPVRRATSRVLCPDRAPEETPHPALSPSDGERVSAATAQPPSKPQGIKHAVQGNISVADSRWPVIRRQTTVTAAAHWAPLPGISLSKHVN